MEWLFVAATAAVDDSITGQEQPSLELASRRCRRRQTNFISLASSNCFLALIIHV